MPLSSANIVADIMDGASQTKQYNRLGLRVYEKYNRVFLVSGANQFSTARTAMIAASNLIEALYPKGSPLPPPGDSLMLARQYDAAPSGSDDVVRVTLAYLYDQIPINATQWTLEVSNYWEVVDTDIEIAAGDQGILDYESLMNTEPVIKNGISPGPPNRLYPIQVLFSPPWQPFMAKDPGPNLVIGGGVVEEDHFENQPVSSFAHVPVYRPRKKLVFTRTLFGASDAQKIETASDSFEGTLNSIAFRNKPPGYWICSACDVMYQPWAGSNLARLEFIGRPTLEGWHPWVRYRNPVYGTPTNVFRLAKGGGPGNGIRQSIQYYAQDFNALLSLFPGGVQGDLTGSGSAPNSPLLGL
jgi:hypothetical protein